MQHKKLDSEDQGALTGAHVLCAAGILTSQLRQPEQLCQPGGMYDDIFFHNEDQSTVGLSLDLCL